MRDQEGKRERLSSKIRNERIAECEIRMSSFEVFSDQIIVSRRPLEVAAIRAQDSGHVLAAVVLVEVLPLRETEIAEGAEVLS